MDALSEKEAQRLLRLEALDVLGASDPTLELFATATAEFTSFPAAAVIFVDDIYAYAKAAYGIPGDWRVPRAQSIAAVVVDTSAPFQDEDLFRSPHFKTHPLVVDAGIRSAAGAPLVLHDGTIPGALLIFDREPRHFSAESIKRLKLMSALAAGLLEQRTYIP
ncbi:MAG: GAF domain-containing protein, partial [Candidatus Eremiobacteraeota bacterium]|nr:GAF domain-containing protein [Candidatus Eremiobacteraeota bacterium]